MVSAPDQVFPATLFRRSEFQRERDRRGAAGPERARKSFTRRHGDSAQRLRTTVQVGFVLLSLWVGVRFYIWVRFYETAGQSVYVPRPPGVEGWLPIAALMNLRYLLLTGEVPAIHAAGMFLLIAFLAMSLLLRKSFCSWVCPVGTVSEWLWQGGAATFGRTWQLPRWLDIPLRSLKYVLLALFLYVVLRMSAEEIRAFLESPYGLVADVKMLDFFRRIGRTSAAVIALLVILSVFVKNAWCRYLCPYGALMGLAAFFSPARVSRDPDACIDCAKCARACPAGLPVDTLLTIRSAECTACLSCVTACPAEGALSFALPGSPRKTAPRRAFIGWTAAVPPWALCAGVVMIFLTVVSIAHLTGHWFTDLPDALYFELIPRAREFGHP